MTAPRDRKAARQLYTDAKTATSTARLAHGLLRTPTTQAELEAATAAEAAAWDAYLAAIYHAPEMELLTEPPEGTDEP